MKKYTKNVVEKMINMRKTGHSYPEISRFLNIPKTSVLRHIKNVKIAPKYYDRWLDRKRSSKLLLINNLKKAKIEAENKITDISEKESVLIAAVIYWCEGAKKDFSFINSDPMLVATFLRSLKRGFSLSDDRFTISLRIYEDLDKDKCAKFWSKITGIRLDKSTSIKILKGSKHGKLKHGMCRVRVKKANLIQKEIFAITTLVSKFTQNAPIV